MQVLPCLLNHQRQFNLVVKYIRFGLAQLRGLLLASYLTWCKYINAQCLASSKSSKNKSNYCVLSLISCYPLHEDSTCCLISSRQCYEGDTFIFPKSQMRNFTERVSNWLKLTIKERIYTTSVSSPGSQTKFSPASPLAYGRDPH